MFLIIYYNSVLLMYKAKTNSLILLVYHIQFNTYLLCYSKSPKSGISCILTID